MITSPSAHPISFSIPDSVIMTKNCLDAIRKRTVDKKPDEHSGLMGDIYGMRVFESDDPTKYAEEHGWEVLEREPNIAHPRWVMVRTRKEKA